MLLSQFHMIVLLLHLQLKLLQLFNATELIGFALEHLFPPTQLVIAVLNLLQNPITLMANAIHVLQDPADAEGNLCFSKLVSSLVKM